MTDDLAPLQRLVADLLVRTGAPERRSLLRAIARDVRQGQATRIAAQQNPDGTPFAPRKPKVAPTGSRLRRQGRVRTRALFARLRLARHLKAGATPDEAWVGFAGRAARIARVHQEGLSDSPAPGQPAVRYARRVLLGMTEAEQARLLDLVLAHVAA